MKLLSTERDVPSACNDICVFLYMSNFCGTWVFSWETRKQGKSYNLQVSAEDI